MKIVALICLLSLILASGCKPNDPDVDDEQDTEPTPPDPVLLTDQKISVDGDQRNYHLFIPSSPRSADIVFLFHGYSGSANQIIGIDETTAPYKNWLEIAARENLLVVVPDGNETPAGQQGWHDCRSDIPAEHPGSDDVAFFNALLAFVQNQYERADARLFVMGTSNGGFMTQRIADEAPEQLTAIAVVISSRPVNSDCAISSMPVSVLFMNGTEDPLTPYNGGQIASDRGEILSTADTIDYWVTRNQTAAVPVITDYEDIDTSENSTIRQYSYASAGSQARVELFEMINGGHTEPSLNEHYSPIFKLIVGNQNRDIEMAEEVWKFFTTHGQ